jgi:hypothetical protein
MRPALSFARWGWVYARGKPVTRKEPHHGRVRHAKEMRASHLFVPGAARQGLLQRILPESPGNRNPVWMPASRMRLIGRDVVNLDYLAGAAAAAPPHDSLARDSSTISGALPRPRVRL